MAFAKQHLGLPTFAYLSLGLGILGTHLFYRDFVKLKFGPLYSLEWLFVMAATCLIFWNFFKRPKGMPSFLSQLPKRKIFWPLGLFFLWGLFHVGSDLFAIQAGTAVKKARFLQHSLLFVYPLLWSVAGYWMWTFSQKWSQKLLFIVLIISALPHLTGLTSITIFSYDFFKWINISVGPILAVPIMLALTGALQSKKLTLKISLFLLVGFFFLFFPIWKMWHGNMQRTVLALLLFLIAATPLIIFASSLKSYKKIGIATLGSVGIAITILMLGIIITGTFHNQSSQRPLGKQLMLTMRDGTIPVGENFSHDTKLGSRRNMWKFAILDWKKQPLVGIGFIPEVPSWVWPSLENSEETWKRVKAYKGTYPELPISGPHNSYLSILARMGVVGLSLFFMVGFHYIFSMRKLFFYQKKNLQDFLLLLIPSTGALYALMNVGLESPHNCLLLWTTFGMGYARVNFLSKNS